MSRVLDLLDTPRSEHDAVIERLRELACRPRMPDPRTVPFTVPTVSKARWHTITSLIATASFVGLIWWVAALVGA